MMNGTKCLERRDVSCSFHDVQCLEAGVNKQENILTIERKDADTYLTLAETME